MRSSGTNGNLVAALRGPVVGATMLLAANVSMAQVPSLDAVKIGEAAGVAATVAADGVVRVAWARDDVRVTVDGFVLHPFAGLGSWATLRSLPEPPGHAMLMGDTVVFEDEVDAAIDAAFAHGLEVTALHNHFLLDEPRVFFLHIGGHGDPLALARGVKATWDAVRAVRAHNAAPQRGSRAAPSAENRITVPPLEAILGPGAAVTAGVAKWTWGHPARMHGVEVGGSMGITTWAAFSGTDARAAVSGDFAMTAAEVQPVLRALRAGGLSSVAIHHHMVGEDPPYYFVHFWGKGAAADLARAVEGAREAQARVQLR
ncbi:MAG TPA: DUF1259 domain-containing protein [Thermoanaerobaculia bacterium]|nr:DUF1259 domain-containing protein [Thermoanaerobaculia bacterium]